MALSFKNAFRFQFFVTSRHLEIAQRNYSLI